MNALLPRDTRELLSKHPSLPDGRSVLFDRYAIPQAKEEVRRQWFERVAGKSAIPVRAKAWQSFITQLGPTHVFAQLQSRLMVNMAGGVMENAGLCLDRFGLPCIPGSAVKGCARRMATQELLEANSRETKADVFFKIALIFGWGDTDWKPGRKRKNGRESEPHSDFWWAMAEDSGDPSTDGKRDQVWRVVAVSVANRLLDRLNICSRQYPEAPWKDLPNFAGTVSFLPAYPVDASGAQLPLPVPPLGKLELDVVTCHHPEYYQGERQVATDDEDPNPVVFPAVAPGHVFAFALAPLRGADDSLVHHARAWLATGLQTFGLGAKTAAGYGWFDASDSVNSAVTTFLTQKAEREKKAVEENAAKEKAEAEAKAKAAEKAERDAALAGLSPEERADKEIELMNPSQFESKVRSFFKEPKKGGPTEEQKKAIVRALRGPRRVFWQDFKSKANKGDLAKAAAEIRQLSKQMFPGNDGKMP